MFSSSTCTSVLSGLHNAENHTRLLNYRPLSLTNCDYKIAAFVFRHRLQNVLPNLISFDQTVYLTERYIGTRFCNLIHVFDYCEESNETMGLSLH